MCNFFDSFNKLVKKQYDSNFCVWFYCDRLQLSVENGAAQCQSHDRFTPVEVKNFIQMKNAISLCHQSVHVKKYQLRPKCS